MGFSRRLGSVGSLAVMLGAAFALGSASATAAGSQGAFLSSLGKPAQLASTVPGNGDVNPYGIAVVTASKGKLVKGGILVSNFNDKANVQGSGKTIMQISASGKASLFAELSTASCPGGIGLTTAIGILPGGWVVVGSFPDGHNGSLPNANPAGCLLVLNSSGALAETWTNANINGPWDLTAVPTSGGAAIFVSDALTRPKSQTVTAPSGLCNVVRLDVAVSSGQKPKLKSATVVGSGFLWKANKATFILAPTGVALGHNGTLYVAETLNNHLTAIPNALTRTTAVKDMTNTLSSGGSLDQPLGLTVAQNGDLIVTNGGDGNAVEITTTGKQVATVTLVKNGAGALFGEAVLGSDQGLVYVNDSTNALDVAKVK